MSAGEIARSLRIAPSSLTFHLGVLKKVGLVDSHRLQRSIIYFVVTAQMQAILEFLMNDCCQEHPEICGFREEHAAVPASANSGSFDR